MLARPWLRLCGELPGAQQVGLSTPSRACSCFDSGLRAPGLSWAYRLWFMLPSVQVIVLALLFLSSPSAWSQAPAVDLPETYSKRPANVLLIIADQWNARCVGYGAGG